MPRPEPRTAFPQPPAGPSCPQRVGTAAALAVLLAATLPATTARGTPVEPTIRVEAGSLSSMVQAAVASTLPDRTFILDNGLTVVLRRDPANPVVAVQMYYKVGARHETIGLTGIAHFVEHMLFRGSDHFGPADVTGVIERAGGEWHGYTWNDGTTFFEAAPKALLPTLLKLEAERMTLARMAANEVDPERGAVFQEYRGYQLNPRSDLFDAVMAVLFLQHPYRNNTMGWESDLAAITHADLAGFYQKYYGPRNAVLAIDGDLDLDEAAAAVRKTFGEIPARGDSVATRTVEPELQGMRRVTLVREGAKPAVLISWLAPAATRPREYASLVLLDAILARPRGLSFEHHSGDQTEGLDPAPAGRLFAVVERGPAASLGTAYVPMIYPGHYSIYATPKPGRTPADLEKAIQGVVRGAREISVESVDAARRLVLSADSVETDSPLEAAHEMAFWTALGGANARREVIEALADVTAEEVQSIARRLTPERCVIGWVMPAGGIGATSGAAAEVPRDPAKPLNPDLRRDLAFRLASDGLKPATEAGVSSNRFFRGTGAALVDSRPALTTFALRFTIAAPDRVWGTAIGDQLRGAAQALAGDRDTTALAAANGLTMSILAPGDGRFDERDTLAIEISGPAVQLPVALRLLGSAVPAALDAPPAPETKAELPDGVALQVLGQAVREAMAGTRPSDWPQPPRSGGIPPGWHEVVNAARPQVFFTLVGPADREMLGSRIRDLAEGIVEKLAPGAQSSRLVKDDPTAPAPPAPRAPFKPGERTVTMPRVVQGRLLIAIPGDTDPVVQDAVAWLLHHNYSGRLGVAAIADSGLVYEMESESSRLGAPLAWFSMGADPSKLLPLTRVLNSVIDTVVRDGFFTDAEVASYRSYVAGRAAVRLAHPDQAARFWTSILLRGGDEKTPAAEAARAAEMGGEEVREAARRMLATPGRLTVTVGGRAER